MTITITRERLFALHALASGDHVFAGIPEGPNAPFL
jgi:hypothetical protein